MMNFLENMLDRLSKTRDRPVLQEVRGGRLVTATGGELLASVAAA